MRSLRKPLLQAGLTRCDYRLASGPEANNKLELSYEDIVDASQRGPHPGLAFEVVRRLSNLAGLYHPDLLVPVPTGANGYARTIAARRRIDYIELDKDKATGQIYYEGNADVLMEQYQRVVIVEDVVTALTSTRQVLDIFHTSPSVKSVVAVWDRGNPDMRLALPEHIALRAIHSEYLPPQLSANDLRWRLVRGTEP